MLDAEKCVWYNHHLRGMSSANFGVSMGGILLLKQLRSGNKVAGVKQSRRAIREGLARQVFLARDADPALTRPLRELCDREQVPVSDQFTMRELGQAAGIQVGAAVVALL